MKKELTKIAIQKLIAHPENPNRMSKTNFEKLKNHIKRTGNYEPVIVRKHPKIEGCFEIINGHHRAEALKQNGETTADCIVWQADDDETRILLTTLNRLGGKDELGLKIEIIKKLSEKYDAKELGKLLPDKKQAIERLKDITKALPLPNSRGSDINLKPMVLFFSDEEMKIVEKAVSKASKNSSKAYKKASAIAKIAQEWLNIIEKEG